MFFFEWDRLESLEGKVNTRHRKDAAYVCVLAEVPGQLVPLRVLANA